MTKCFTRVALLLCLLLGLSYYQNSVAEVSFDDALVDAADRNASSTISQLLKSSYPVDSKGKFGVTALMRAAYRGNVEIVEKLLNVGANPNSVDIGGATAMHLASREGHTKVINMLIKYNAFVDMSDNEGWTPLMRSVLANKPDVAKILIGAGADINASNKNRETPLIHAVHRRNYALAKMLLDNGANPTQVNSLGFSVLDIAKRKRNPKIETLIRNAVDKDYAGVDGGKGGMKEPASFKYKNFELDVKDPKKVKKKTEVAKADTQPAEKTAEIVERLGSFLKRKKEKPAVALTQEEIDATLAEMAKLELPKTLDEGEVELQNLPWVSDGNMPEQEVVEVAETKPEPKNEPASLTPKKEVQIASVKSVKPIPVLRPYKPVSNTPWLEESGQKDLLAKLRKLEKDTSLPVPKSMEKKFNKTDQQPTEVASSVTSSTEPEVLEQKVATLVSPPKPSEKPDDSVLVEGIPWVSPKAPSIPKATELAEQEKKPEETVAETTPPIEAKEVVMSEAPTPVEEKTITPPAADVIGETIDENGEKFIELAATAAPPSSIVKEKTDDSAWAKTEEVKKEVTEDRPWLTPNELKDNLPERLAVKQEEEKLKLAAVKESKTALWEKSEAEKLKEMDEKLKQKSQPPEIATPAPVEKTKTVQSDPNKPTSILPDALKEEEIEEVATKAVVKPQEVQIDEKSEEAKVEVSEAIRVPLSAPKKVEVAKAEPGETPEKKIPTGFSPSYKGKSKKFWLEISRFGSEEAAISHFDTITAREKLYLRMRLITPAKRSIQRGETVSLRVGTFDSNEEAADICLSFKTETLRCAIVRDSGQSAPAKTAHPFRFGFERGTYRNEYAYRAPSAGGKYYWVQLGTFTNEFEAIGHWQSLKREHGDVLSPLKVNLTTPRRSSSSSQSLRLRAGPFMAKANANAACRRLKKRFVSCLAVSGK